MSSQELYRKKSPASSKPKRVPESPFLDEELSADKEIEAAEAWASGLVRHQLESPFQYAFEPEQESSVEPEIDEFEEELHDEELDEVDEHEFDEEFFSESDTGIIDGDNRVRIKKTTGVPWRWICKVTIKDNRDRIKDEGTGVLVSDRHVLTAAHVVYDEYVAPYKYSIKVTPGLNGGKTRPPFGTYPVSQKPKIPKYYDPQAKNRFDWDYALLTLKRRVGRKKFSKLAGKPLCYWGHPKCGQNTIFTRPDPKNLNGKSVLTAGYPTRKGGKQLWCAAGQLHSVNWRQRTLWRTMWMSADTTKGQSGSPVWVREKNRYCLVGIAVGAGENSNRVVRVTRELLNQVRDWITADGDTPTMREIEETFEPEVALDESFEQPPIHDEGSEEEEDFFDPETEDSYGVGAEVNDEVFDEELEQDDETIEPVADEYEFDDEWDDEELDELDDTESYEAIEDEDFAGAFADAEESLVGVAILDAPVSRILGELRPLERSEAAEFERPSFEKQVRKHKKRRDCKHYPSALNVTRWQRRTDPNLQKRKAEFRRLREAKKLIIAVLSRGRIRLPLVKVEWLSDMFGANHWSKHLTTDLSELVDEVNVTIELHKVLAPVQESDIRLLFENRTYRIHLTDLRRCRFYMGWYGSIDKKAFLERSFGIDLDRMFRRSRVPFPATRQNATEYLLVAYASFPSWIEDQIRRKLSSLNSDVQVIPEISSVLTVTRLGRARIELPVENVRWMLEESQRKKRTHWVRRLNVDLLQLMAATRRSLVTIDLLRVEGPITGHQMLSGKLAAQFSPYVKRLNEPNADDWPFVIFQILPLSARSGLEHDLQVDLEELFSLPSRHGVSSDELALLVHVAFPKLVKRLIIPRKEARIAGFEFGRHRLTQNIRKEISLVGRYVADSWRRVPWHAFRPVRGIEIVGYTDSVGTEEFNLELGLARAREAEKWLKREIRKHWGGAVEPTTRIRFTPPDSKGEAEPRKPDDPQKGNPANRRVEIRLDAPEPENVLKDLRDRVNRLLDDSKSAEYPITPQTTEKLKCMLKKLENPDVDDQYIDPMDILNQEFTPDILQSVRDFLMHLTYQDLSPEPQSDRNLLKALDDFTGRIYQVRTVLQNNANIRGEEEDPKNTAKRGWIWERIDPDSPKGKKSILSCFPPLDL